MAGSSLRQRTSCARPPAMSGSRRRGSSVHPFTWRLRLASHRVYRQTVANSAAAEVIMKTDTYWRLLLAEEDRLGEVRGVLKRIQDGPFGRSVVDGGPIDEERLRAIPWTPVCSRHAHLRKASESPRTS